LTAFLFKSKNSKIKIPYFIGLFVVAMLVNTYAPSTAFFTGHLVGIAKIGLTITLFLIGATLNFATLKTVGLKPLLQGIFLWIFIAVLALVSILYLG